MKSLFSTLLFSGLLVLLAACTAQTPQITAEPPITAAPTITPARFTTESLRSLEPTDILLQRDYEPGFTRPELHHPYGRVPLFTLYADGQLIYLDAGRTEADQKVMAVQLSPDEAAGLVQPVLDLGYERLTSHTDNCQPQDDGTMMCVMDAGTAILRARLPDRQLRKVKIYHDFANDPEAFQAINTLLTSYSHPDARPYEPEKATLFLRRIEEARDVPVQDWPLDPERLRAVEVAEQFWARSLTGEELASYLAAVDRNVGDTWFEHNGRFYNGYLVPWLPGADYSRQIEADFPTPGPLPGGGSDPGTVGDLPGPEATGENAAIVWTLSMRAISGC